MSASPRRITIALALVLASALAACGSGDGDGPSAEGNQDLFTSDGFQRAVDAVADEAGDDAGILKVEITQAGADFKLLDGEGATGLLYTGGELQDVQVDVVGPLGPGGREFPLSEVEPDAIDEIVDGVGRQTGGANTVVNAITLERGGVDGELGWTINTRASDPASSANLVFHAGPDGTLAPAVRSLGEPD